MREGPRLTGERVAWGAGANRSEAATKFAVSVNAQLGCAELQPAADEGGPHDIPRAPAQ